MSETIYYQDWLVKGGDSPSYPIGRLYKSLHAMMRKHGESVVIVPLAINDSFELSVKESIGAPDGLRIYMSEKGKSVVEEHLTLPPAYRSTFIVPPIAVCAEGGSQVTVRRLSRFGRRDGNAEIRRFERRHPGDTERIAQKARAVRLSRSKKLPSQQACFFHVESSNPDAAPFRVYLATEVLKRGAQAFSASGTYGAGSAPLAGLKAE